jgi:hypothetical protein
MNATRIEEGQARAGFGDELKVPSEQTDPESPWKISEGKVKKGGIRSIKYSSRPKVPPLGKTPSQARSGNTSEASKKKSPSGKTSHRSKAGARRPIKRSGG